MILHDDTFPGAEGAEGEERGVLMSDVVTSDITTSSQEGRDGEARVNVFKRRRKRMIKSASL